MAAAAKIPAVVYEALILVTAQAELLHHDDTPIRRNLGREQRRSVSYGNPSRQGPRLPGNA